MNNTALAFIGECFSFGLCLLHLLRGSKRWSRMSFTKRTLFLCSVPYALHSCAQHRQHHRHICPVSVYFLPAHMITFVNSKNRCMSFLWAVRAFCVLFAILMYYILCLRAYTVANTTATTPPNLPYERFSVPTLMFPCVRSVRRCMSFLWAVRAIHTHHRHECHGYVIECIRINTKESSLISYLLLTHSCDWLTDTQIHNLITDTLLEEGSDSYYMLSLC